MASHFAQKSVDQQSDETRQREDFARWRPSYHFIASHGWLNDPCAPGYNPITRIYHIAFQWNPKRAEWGDIVWGKAVSRDLVSWTVSSDPCLERDAPYDKAGVFTGCMIPKALNGDQDGTLTYLYTSVSRLPIHHTLPYHRGCETLSVATSKDDGQTWTKVPCNPVLPGPPEGVQVTGWRDPYVAEWPALSKALGQTKPTLFGIISGGIVDKSPTSLLYTVEANDLTSWQFIAPLIKVGRDFRPSPWTGHMGVNWEVTNFMTLKDGHGASQEFLVFGAEGLKDWDKSRKDKAPSGRANRAQLWLAGDMVDGGRAQAGTDPLMKYRYGGVFDHGLLYAANGFWDPATQQQVMIGWVTEDDLPVDLQLRQNWSGCLSLPRTISLTTLQNVKRARRLGLQAITSFQAQAESNGTYTLRTMRIRPDKRLEKMRLYAWEINLRGTELASLGDEVQMPLQTSRWESISEYSVGPSCTSVGVAIFHAPGPGSRTVLSFHPESETFTISRPPVTLPGYEPSPIPLQTETAVHTLFTTCNSSGAEEEERLRIHVYYDGSVLEVFVNERTVITTRVYLPNQDCKGLAFFAEGPAFLVESRLWDGLALEQGGAMSCL